MAKENMEAGNPEELKSITRAKGVDLFIAAAIAERNRLLISCSDKPSGRPIGNQKPIKGFSPKQKDSALKRFPRYIFLLDYSPSMFRRKPSEDTMIQIMKKNLSEMIDNKLINNMDILAFSKDVEYIGQFRDASELLHALEDHDKPFQQRTHLWDSLIRVICRIDSEQDTYLFCITDGEDNASKHNYGDVKMLAGRLSRLHLQIIDLKGSIGKALSNEDTVKSIDEPEKLDELIVPIIENHTDLKVRNPRPLNVSVSIVDLINSEERDVKLVRKAVREAISYLEELTKLRYYPVTTFLIDSWYFKEPKPISISEGLAEDILEILEFLRSVSVTFHSGSFSKDVRGSDYYSEFCSLGKKQRWELTAYAEGVAIILILFLKEPNRKQELFNTFYPTSFNTFRSPLLCVEEHLHNILLVMEKIADTYPETELKAGYFEVSDDKGSLKCPQIDIWAKHVTKSELEVIRNAIRHDGMWNLGIHQIISVMSIALRVVFPLLYKYLSTIEPLSEIVSIRERLGFYQSAEATTSNIKKRYSSFSGHAFDDSGGVFICLESLKNAYEKIIAGKLESIKLDFYEFLLSVVIHEHAHAITYEGIDRSARNPYYSNTTRTGKRYKLVSESIAKWCELDFFRNSDQAYDIVMAHACSGEPPAWPYAGALLFEGQKADEREYFFREVLASFREDALKAFRKLTRKGSLKKH